MKKGVVIILIIFALLLCCCVVLLGGGYFLLNSAVSQSEPAQELAYQLCESRDGLSESTFENVFTENFKDTTTFEETDQYLYGLFPSDFKCEELKGNNIISLLTKGYSISTVTDMDGTTAEYVVKVEDITTTFYYRFENNEWLVEGLYTE